MEYGYFERRLKSKDAELATLRAENAALKEKLERIAGTSGLSRDAEICRTIAKEALK